MVGKFRIKHGACGKELKIQVPDPDRIHGTNSIFTYQLLSKPTIHVGKYTSPMDPMAMIKLS